MIVKLISPLIFTLSSSWSLSETTLIWSHSSLMASYCGVQGLHAIFFFPPLQYILYSTWVALHHKGWAYISSGFFSSIMNSKCITRLTWAWSSYIMCWHSYLREKENVWSDIKSVFVCVCLRVCVCVRLSSPFRSGVWLQSGDALREREEHRPSLRQALYWGRGEERYSQTHSRPPADVIPSLLQTREGNGSALWHKSSNKNVPRNVCDWLTERTKKKKKHTRSRSCDSCQTKEI